MKIGVLALQGAFKEHIDKLDKLGVGATEIRQRPDLENLSGIIIPGGESTTIGKLLNELEIMEPLKKMIQNGLPVFGTCAGMILLCKNIENSDKKPNDQPRLGVLDATALRNAFGRQVDSFEKKLKIPALGETPFPAVFIRAPAISQVGSAVEILAKLPGAETPVAIRQKNILAASFHPELTNDLRFHSLFADMCKR